MRATNRQTHKPIYVQTTNLYVCRHINVCFCVYVYVQYLVCAEKVNLSATYVRQGNWQIRRRPQLVVGCWLLAALTLGNALRSTLVFGLYRLCRYVWMYVCMYAILTTRTVIVFAARLAAGGCHPWRVFAGELSFQFDLAYVLRHHHSHRHRHRHRYGHCHWYWHLCHMPDSVVVVVKPTATTSIYAFLRFVNLVVRFAVGGGGGGGGVSQCQLSTCSRDSQCGKWNAFVCRKNWNAQRCLEI